MADDEKTKKVKLVLGPRAYTVVDGDRYGPGDEVEVDERQAERLLARGSIFKAADAPEDLRATGEYAGTSEDAMAAQIIAQEKRNAAKERAQEETVLTSPDGKTTATVTSQDGPRETRATRAKTSS